MNNAQLSVTSSWTKRFCLSQFQGKSRTDLHNMSQTNVISVFLNKMCVCDYGSSFYFLKVRNSLNFRSFCILEYWRNDSLPKKDFAKIILTSLRQIM